MQRALIFDSGIGGLSVCDAIVAAGLALEIDYAGDNAWLPYGDKSDDALRARVPALLAALTQRLQPDLVVMACNTASTIALDAARAVIAQPIVGVVPPIKPAAELTRTGTIAILATPATVTRPYTKGLIAQFAAGKRVIRYGSTKLVAAAEAKLAGERVDPAAIDDAIAHLFGAEGGAAIDVIALACTHFPLLRAELEAAAPRTCTWLDSGAAIARRVGALLNLAPGAAQTLTRASLFTALEHAPRAALKTRGFKSFAAIGAAPAFEIAHDFAAGAV